MKVHGPAICKATAGLVATLLAIPALAGGYSPYVETWRDRAVQGAFVSVKSAGLLRRCVATQIKTLTASDMIHSEDLNPHVTEVDASAMLLGVRIVDQGDKRVLLFVSDPGLNDKAAAAIRDCA